MRYPWPWPWHFAHHAALGALAACFAPGGNPGQAPGTWVTGSEAEVATWLRYPTRSPLPDWIARAVEDAILAHGAPAGDGIISLSYAVFAPSNASRLIVIVSDQGERCAGGPTFGPYRGPRRPCRVYAVAVDAGGHASPMREGYGCLPARAAIAPDGTIQAVGNQITEFRYDPGARQIEGRVRDVGTDSVTCSFVLPAPNSVD